MKVRLLLISVLFSLLGGCATNPVTGKNELTLVSRDSEISIGVKQYLPAQQSQGGLYRADPELNEYVARVGERLAGVSDNDLPYEFVVLNDSTPNAWALPGGKIAVNRGLLTTLENEAELAAVLGHEIVHAAARHGAKAVERSMLLQGAVLLTAIGTSDSQYSNYILGGAALGSQLITQRYGRQAELESDLYGTRYMARAGYDPDAAVTLQKKFVALGKKRSTSWLQGLFASHPPSEQRVARNRETAMTVRAELPQAMETGEDRFQARLAYLRSKRDAYAAYDQAVVLAGKKETAVALKRIEKAIAMEPNDPKFYGLKANLLHNSREYSAALNEYNEALRRDDAYYEFYLGRGLTWSKLGERAKARSDLERSNQLLPTALATNELGNLSLVEGDRARAKAYFGEVARTSGSIGKQAAEQYIRLDLPENPAQYLKAKVSLQRGMLVATISNPTNISLKSARVQVSAVVNGQRQVANVNTRALGGKSSVAVRSGIRAESPEVVEQASAIVTSVAM